MGTIGIGAAFVGGGVVLALLGVIGVRHLVPPRVLIPSNSVAGTVHGAAATACAVVLAFAVITAWTQFTRAQTIADDEANAVAELLRLANGFPTPVNQGARTAALTYAQSVVDDEWPAMARGEAPAPRTSAALDELWRVYATEAPRAGASVALTEPALTQLAAIETARRQRILASRSGLPAMMWVALGGASVLLMIFSLFFGVERPIVQGGILAMLAAVIALLMFVVYALDHPFRGVVHVQPAGFTLLLQHPPPAAVGILLRAVVAPRLGFALICGGLLLQM